MISIPRLTFAALKGGAGKTLITIGIAAALARSGKQISIFKKGPDYIDSGWLGRAARSDCHNLDAYLCPPDKLLLSFATHSAGKDLAIVEGNRGLYDGVDSAGHFSTAELAKLLRSKIILIIDATKMTRTAAAMVLGCGALDPGVTIGGVILNRVAGARHERILRDSIENVTGIPVIGSIPKLSIEDFPQRHLGLLTLLEHPGADRFLDESANMIENSVDFSHISKLASATDALPIDLNQNLYPSGNYDVNIGVLKDSAFQFYYPENLEALKRLGAKLVFFNSLTDTHIGNIDAMYIGGGFPETHAEKLAQNNQLKSAIYNAAQHGLPIYAECGGLMYLSKSLVIDNNNYPMVGIFPIETILERKPQGHGYIHVEVQTPNPFYPVGTALRGHEFHYSYVTGLERADARFIFKVTRGHGMDGFREGICVHNTLGTYVHIHALGEPLWAEGIVKQASAYKNRIRNT